MAKKYVFSFLIIIPSVLIPSLAITLYSLNFSHLLIVMLGIFVLLGILKNPLIGLALVIASPTLIVALPQVPLFSSMAPLIGLLTVVAFLLKSRLRFERTTKIGKEMYSLMFMFLVLSIPGSFLNEHADRNWAFTYFQLLIMVFLIQNLVQTKKSLKSLLVIIFICIEISATFSILNYFQVSQAMPWIRATGLSGDPNELATYNITALCIGYYLITNTNNLMKKCAYMLLIILLLMSLILSGSRGGALTLIIVVGYLLIVNAKINLRPIIIGLVLAILIVYPIIQILPESLLSRFREIPQSIVHGDKTVLYRLELWRSSLDVWLEHPVFGVGSGMVTAYKMKNNMYVGVDRTYVTHNTYINILAEMGIVGFMLFMGIISLAVKSYYFAVKHSKNIDPAAHRFAVLLTSILICWLTSSISLNLQQNKFLWMSFGLALVIQNLVNNYNLKLKLPVPIKHSLSVNALQFHR